MINVLFHNSSKEHFQLFHMVSKIFIIFIIIHKTCISYANVYFTIATFMLKMFILQTETN